MPLSGRYRAVVFDMDGLLLDTEVLWHDAEAELFRRHGGEYTLDDKLALLGTSFDETARHFARRLGLPPGSARGLLGEVIGLMSDALRGEVQARPGAVELVRRLTELDRVPVGLASNSPRRLVDAALATAGLTDAFEAIVTSDDVPHAKPAPDIYLEVCRRLDVPASEALALEDSASGVAAAKAAGLTVIAVPQYAEVDVSAADQVVDSLEDLLAGV